MIYEEDWSFLSEVYGPSTLSKIGPGNAIKEIVHGHVGKIRDKAALLIDERARELTQ